MAPSPLPKPQKTIDEMSPEEFEAWRAWLFTEGVNPVASRGDIPASVSSYSWDAALGATVEHVNSETYVVELIDGKLTRVGSRKSPLVMTATATPSVPELRIREVA